VAFQRVYVRGPEAAELRQPRIELLKWLRPQPVHTPLCIHRGLHKPSLTQHPQVLGDGRLRHAQLTLDLPHRLLRDGQKPQYRPAVGFGNDFEGGWHVLYIPCYVYTCQGISKTNVQHQEAFIATEVIGEAIFRPACLARMRFYDRRFCKLLSVWIRKEWRGRRDSNPRPLP